MLGSLEIDMKEQRIPRSEVTIACGKSKTTRFSLLDSGAGLCHMSFGLWKLLELDALCFNDNPQLMSQMGIKSKEDLVFEKLPLRLEASTLGDRTKAAAYLTKIDQLTLGEIKAGSNPIRLNDITVKVINSDKLYFIVGVNVLRYTSVSYSPSPERARMRISLEQAGLDWFEQDRKNGLANSMTSMFNYLE